MVATLRESALSSTMLGTGDRAPDFELPSISGEKVSLAERLQGGPAVVTFYRGGWCSFCNLELRAYERIYTEFEKVGASLLAISPERPDHGVSTAESNGLSFDVLSDDDNRIARLFGLVFELPPAVIAYSKDKNVDLTEINGADRWELPVPATYVIDRDQIIVVADANPDYTVRLEPSDVLEALTSLRQPDS